MDEWAVRGAVMKTGLGGEKVRVRGVGRGGEDEEEGRGGQHERKGKLGYAERRADERLGESGERWRRQREANGRK